VIDVKDSSGTVISKTRHYFYDFFGMQGTYNILPMRLGKEYKTEILDPVSATVLRRTETTWIQREAFQWCSDSSGFYSCDTTTDPNSGPPVDPRISEVKTTLETGQVMKKTFLYDQYNNIADSYEYDWGNPQPGALLRRTHTAYVTDANYTNYNNGRLLLRLPLQTWVSSDVDGNSKTSFTAYEYDNYNTVANHAALIPRSNVSGYDTNFHTGYTPRGNPTAVTSYTNAQAQTGPVVVYTQYDVLGNRVKLIDAKGLITTFDYSDRFGTPSAEARANWDTVSSPAQLSGKSTFAFATQTSNPGNYVVYNQFDYSTGQIVDAEDFNGSVSSSFYNDSLDRVTQVILANNRPTFKNQRTTVYDDVTHKITVTSDLFAFNDGLIKSETLYNSLGQTTEVRTYESGGYIAVKREYDAIGRPAKVSNPYRPYLNETVAWTITEYDSLGRPSKVKATDTTEALLSYSGNATTVTDQAGKSRRSLRNALDQVVRVDEPNSSNDLGTVTSPTQPTYYTYNASGQLVRVDQGEQSRIFLFDSIGRLLRVKQPEQIVNANLALADPITGNSQWTTGSTYDPNGNTLTTTDAKGVTITQTFDALNRVLTKTYSDTTPAITYTYDDPAVNFSKGQLTKVSSSISVTEHTDFDPLGKVLSHKQTTGGQIYTTAYTYTLNGALYDETYPSGRIVRSTLNNDGRISDVSSKKVGQGTFQTHANNFSYAPHGAVSQMRLGNGDWESQQFNVRLQPSQVAVGTTAGGTDVFRTGFEYGEIDAGGNFLASKNNGNIARQTITVPGVSPTFVQTYKYDVLNRLKEAKEMNGAVQTWIQTLDYDRYGNRTTFNQTKVGEQPITQTPAVSTASNRITAAGYVYDFNGNLTQDNLGRQFTFDGSNKQTQVKDSLNNVIGTYYYDGSGRRVQKITASETVVYVYDVLGRLVAEYSTQAAANPGLSYVTTDNVGSPRVLTDSAGAVLARRDFMPFGEELVAGTANRATAQKYGSGIDKLRNRFTGYQKDAETGLDFAEARYYDNRYARFTAVDPLLASGKSADPQTFNRYAYVQNNPLVLIDPTGMWADNEWYTVEATSLFDESYSITRPIPLVFWTETIGPKTSPPRMTNSTGEEEGSPEHSAEGDSEHGTMAENEQQTPSHSVVFDSVELLDNAGAGFEKGPLGVPRPARAVAHARQDQFNANAFTLDVANTEVDPNGVMAIRVNFHGRGVDLDPKLVTVSTTDAKNRRWEVLTEYVGQNATQVDYGQVTFRVKVFDKEGKINPINVRVGSTWTASIWDKGKVNDNRSAYGEISIRIVIGPDK
jgi:RHS repeat-associated protein